MSWTPTGVVRRRTGWTLLVQSSTGERRELKYRSLAQARYFAAVISLGPQQLPPDDTAKVALQAERVPRPASTFQGELFA